MKIFLAGASGYIGGTVARALLDAGHAVTGLVRSDARAADVRRQGIVPVLGTLADADVLARESRAADAVIHAASADDRPSVAAILDALRGSGKAFVHTSGSGLVADAAGGQASDRVYDEGTPVQPLPARVPRLALIDDIRRAAANGVRSAVIAPPMIYGRGRGANPHSVQVPKLIAVAREHGVALHVGPGANAWSNVHVEDLADLYVRAVERAPAGAFYYAENGENTLAEVCAAIGRMLGFTEPPRALSLDESHAVFGEMPTALSYGANSRVRAKRAREELGWAPSRPALTDEIERGCYARER